MAKNWHIQSNISGYSEPIFTIFSPYESALSADDKSVPCFPICWGTLSWQSIDFGKFHERWLIPLAFFALSFENELQYHCLNVRANSGDDVAISCKNLVNFCWVTPEITELIWELHVYDTANKLAFLVEYLRIYWTDFYNIFTVWKPFECRW